MIQTVGPYKQTGLAQIGPIHPPPSFSCQQAILRPYRFYNVRKKCGCPIKRVSKLTLVLFFCTPMLCCLSIVQIQKWRSLILFLPFKLSRDVVIRFVQLYTLSTLRFFSLLEFPTISRFTCNSYIAIYKLLKILAPLNYLFWVFFIPFGLFVDKIVILVYRPGKFKSK